MAFIYSCLVLHVSRSPFSKTQKWLLESQNATFPPKSQSHIWLEYTVYTCILVKHSQFLEVNWARNLPCNYYHIPHKLLLMEAQLILYGVWNVTNDIKFPNDDSPIGRSHPSPFEPHYTLFICLMYLLPMEQKWWRHQQLGWGVVDP